MKHEVLHNRTIPLTYVLLTMQQAEERGVSRARLLRGLPISPAVFEQAETRLSLLQYTQIIYRALEETGDPSLGYEFALRCNLTAHGFFGYGLMSQPTLREVVEFAIRFVQLCTPCYSVRLSEDATDAVIEVSEAIPFGPLYQYGFDMFLVCFARMAQQLEIPFGNDLELWFPWPEPPHFERYRDQLPARLRFSMPAFHIRVPRKYANLPIRTGNALTAQLLARQCERELSLLGLSNDLLARVRAALATRIGSYPDLTTLSQGLFMSTRTLKRRLQEHGRSYQQLLDEARHRDALRLLDGHGLSIEEIADRLGYSSSANFTRAFRKWTGTTPGAWRHRGAELPMDAALVPA
ncbi:AraC family transcriptional regulator [Solimonas sp. K1W22B-7]|uniref:AraC family transcriptional regulator n=1 Tax=Solimonas sp. K1W22B-7 TaxID=2303331 RepID=UPI000E33222F|nr:AraC family transcriptional regulator [Solimonas sp. K1W22B-7]AXQ31534.1 AraC family transcriptional regulator [Solimonas sp. K1W22B-7]